jgi:protein ImuA
LVEVLQPLAVHHEWGLVSPAVASWQTHTPGPGLLPRPGVVLIGPPHHAFTPALAALGLQTHGLMEVGTDDPAQRLWACEQALQCPEVGAVLAWLPHAPMAALRRLQLAVARQGGLLWVFRPLAVQHQASPAVLRLWVQPGSDGTGLQVHVLKRRGPLLANAVPLAPCNLTLQAALEGARWRNRLRRSVRPPSTTEVPHDTPLALAGAGHRHTAHA